MNRDKFENDKRDIDKNNLKLIGIIGAGVVLFNLMSSGWFVTIGFIYKMAKYMMKILPFLKIDPLFIYKTFRQNIGKILKQPKSENCTMNQCSDLNTEGLDIRLKDPEPEIPTPEKPEPEFPQPVPSPVEIPPAPPPAQQPETPEYPQPSPELPKPTIPNPELPTSEFPMPEIPVPPPAPLPTVTPII